MSVKIDPVPFGTWTNEEYNDIIQSIENSIPDALEAIKGAAEQQKKIVENNIKDKRALKQSIPSKDPYYFIVSKRMQDLKSKSFYIFQVQSKIENIQLCYQRLIHIHDLKPNVLQKKPNEADFMFESETLLLQRVTNQDIEALIESYYNTLPQWEKIGEILKFLRTQFLILLHDTILHPNRKQEDEENLILEILSELSGIKEFYNLSK